MLSTKRFQRAAGPIAAASVILAGLLSACASTDAAAPAPVAAAPQAVSTPAPVRSGPSQAQGPAKTQGWLQVFTGSAPAGGTAVQLAVSANSAVGQYITSADRALYRFDKDTAKPPASNCSGDCLVKWPPLTVQRGQAVYVTGIDAQLVGFIERADGACQITVAGWPVYFFAKDEKPGDLLGQGVGGVWHAVTPTGGKAGVN